MYYKLKEPVLLCLKGTSAAAHTTPYREKVEQILFKSKFVIPIY